MEEELKAAILRLDIDNSIFFFEMIGKSQEDLIKRFDEYEKESL